MRKVGQSRVAVGGCGPEPASVPAGRELSKDPQLQTELSLHEEVLDLARQRLGVELDHPQPGRRAALATHIDAVAALRLPGKCHAHALRLRSGTHAVLWNIKLSSSALHQGYVAQGASGRCRSSDPPGRQSELRYPSGIFGYTVSQYATASACAAAGLAPMSCAIAASCCMAAHSATYSTLFPDMCIDSCVSTWTAKI